MYPNPGDIWSDFWQQTWSVVTKTVLPALIAVSVGIAVKMQKKRITVLNAIGSYVIGVGFAFICGFWIHENFSQGTATLLIGAVAITSEKIGHWIMFKLEVDGLLGDAMDWVRKKLK